MVIAILQFDLHVPGSESLKDKRRVVSSVKDRLHREHRVSVAEIGALESLSVARLGLAMVTNDVRHAAQTLDAITNKLRTLRDAELGDVSREFLRGQGAEGVREAADPSAVIDQELLDYASSEDEEDKA